MAELIVDIGNIEIPQGFRKDRGVYRPAKRGERYVTDTVCEATCEHVMNSIVLIPEPQPYVWPPWCRLWGAAMDAAGSIWLYPSEPSREEGGWNSRGKGFYDPDDAIEFGLTPPTREHFTDWKTPLLNPHWKGE